MLLASISAFAKVIEVPPGSPANVPPRQPDELVWLLVLVKVGLISVNKRISVLLKLSVNVTLVKLIEVVSVLANTIRTRDLPPPLIETGENSLLTETEVVRRVKGAEYEE